MVHTKNSGLLRGSVVEESQMTVRGRLQVGSIFFGANSIIFIWTTFDWEWDRAIPHVTIQTIEFLTEKDNATSRLFSLWLHKKLDL